MSWYSYKNTLALWASEKGLEEPQRPTDHIWRVTVLNEHRMFVW